MLIPDYKKSGFCDSIALFSRAASSQVFSALQSLTTVFGMGTGGTSAPKTPDIHLSELLLPNNMAYYITNFRKVNPFFEIFLIFFIFFILVFFDPSEWVKSMLKNGANHSIISLL